MSTSSSSDMSISERQMAFNQLFGISDQDLEINKQGHLSEQQRNKLLQETKKGDYIGKVLVVITLGIFLLSLANLINEQDSAEVMGRLIGSLWLALPVLGAIFFWKAMRLPSPLLQKPVVSIEGVPSLDRVRVRTVGMSLSGLRFYYLKIANQEFSIHQKLHSLFKDYPGKKYKIYYSENSEYIVSVEVLN